MHSADHNIPFYIHMCKTCQVPKYRLPDSYKDSAYTGRLFLKWVYTEEIIYKKLVNQLFDKGEVVNQSVARIWVHGEVLRTVTQMNLNNFCHQLFFDLSKLKFVRRHPHRLTLTETKF